MTTYIGGFFDTLCRRLMGGGCFSQFSKKQPRFFSKNGFLFLAYMLQ